MFDIAPSEFMLFALVALIVIGPKDLPKAMRVVGRFVGKARGMANQFRSGFDAMVREAELEEMEKKWKEENARIMAEHSALTDLTLATPAPPATEPPVDLPDVPVQGVLPAPSTNEEKPA
jgi:sec-independent protein translocase protein TatB